MKQMLFVVAGIISTVLGQRIRDPLAWQGGNNLRSVQYNQNYTNGTFQSQIDHFNKSDTRMFNIRWWKNEKYSTKDGPIFIYICGEWTCAPPSDDATAMAFGASKGALLLALEHRYYGNSQPFSDAQGGWSYDNLKWLNTTQALEDIEVYVQKIKLEYGANRKILLIGGSYPGAVVSWFKVAHPDSVTAIWSSSGVIHAIKNFTMFDYDIYNATSQSAGCSEMIAKITSDIDNVFLKGTLNDKLFLLNRFAVINPDITHGDFMWYLADMFTMGVQYGGRTEMCSLLTSKDFQTDTWRKLYTYGFKKGVSASQYDAKDLAKTRVDFNSNLRQWTYQYCSEFGWFQVPHADHPMRSQALNLTYWSDYCQRIFSPNMPGPGWEQVNAMYHGTDLMEENIYFFNAREDPWQYAGMEKLSKAQKKNSMKYSYIDCPDCGHCIDLQTPSPNDPQVLVDGRAKAIKKISKWMGLSEEEPTAKLEKTKKVKKNIWQRAWKRATHLFGPRHTKNDTIKIETTAFMQ